MSKKDYRASLIEIGDLHAMRIDRSIQAIQSYIPLKPNSFLAFTDAQFAYLEMIVSRFAKLQDMIGAKFFPLLLESYQQESALGKPFLDVLNNLEKLNILPNAKRWMAMRELRNHVVHEYPDNPSLMCQNLNETIVFAQELIQYWSFLKPLIQELDKEDILE